MFENHKKVSFNILASFENLKLTGQTVLLDRSVLIGKNMLENAKNAKIKMRHFEQFSNNMTVFW